MCRGVVSVCFFAFGLFALCVVLLSVKAFIETIRPVHPHSREGRASLKLKHKTKRSLRDSLGLLLQSIMIGTCLSLDRGIIVRVDMIHYILFASRKNPNRLGTSSDINFSGVLFLLHSRPSRRKTRTTTNI